MIGKPVAVSRLGQRLVCHAGSSYRRWLPPASKQQSMRFKGSPVREYLLSSLRLRDPVVDTLIALYPALAEYSTSDLKLIVDPNLSLLKDLAPTDQVTKLVCTKPRLLAMPLSSWYEFLSAYGLSDKKVWNLINEQPGVMLQGNIYAAGKAIMFLKALGWSDLEINVVVIPSYPEVLRMDVECELQPVVDYVQQLGLPEELTQELLQQYPSIFCHNYKQVIADLLAGSERYWSKQQHWQSQGGGNCSSDKLQPEMATEVHV